MVAARRGSVALEFALVAPILLVLLAGAVEWGDILSREVALVQVARDAALAGARAEHTDIPEAVAHARGAEALAAAGFDAGSATITVDRVSLPTGDAITVVVAVPSAGLLGLLPVPDQLSAETTARLEDQ